MFVKLRFGNGQRNLAGGLFAEIDLVRGKLVNGYHTRSRLPLIFASSTINGSAIIERVEKFAAMCGLI